MTVQEQALIDLCVKLLEENKRLAIKADWMKQALQQVVGHQLTDTLRARIELALREEK
jgi:hypothetical protein